MTSEIKTPEGEDRLPLVQRVLVVDDHVDTLAALCRFLASLGLSATGAPCVEEALSHLRIGKFDLLICDIGLSDGDGCELLKKGLDIQPIKAIALSGYGMALDIQRSLAAGFSHHLVKPIDIQQLKAVIDELLPKSGGERTAPR